MRRRITATCAMLIAAATLFAMSAATAHADGDVHKVNHVIVIMQENHSFDNYFGALPYAPGSPYHAGACKNSDHSCVDGLTCSFDMMGHLNCTNSNLDDDGSTVTSFHEFNYCPGPDLDHGWGSSHKEANFS
ncbi:MAG TPA: alkaline phosphatase family protein, partial [Candidatus Binatus sp.]|nr:alkaline phosphatase family protein [Candidatus Binatus sp.]